MLKRVLFLALIILSASAFSQSNPFDFLKPDNHQLLSEEEAFQVVNAEIDNGLIKVIWRSASDYYLYRKNFKIVPASQGVEIGAINFPQGVIEPDPLFGDVEVYFFDVELTAPISMQQPIPQSISLVLHSQGCNKPVGVCYPPQVRNVDVAVNQIEYDSNPKVIKQPTQEKKTLWAYAIAAFGAGLLLVFTPCVLPMLPILSGLVVGGPQNHSKIKAGLLSFAYVLGTIITYTLMGILAGAAGLQLQAYFQNPIAIILMCTILVLMALAMFGAFSFTLPSSLQGKVTSWTEKLSSGTYVFALVLGLLSALVVSACVSPLLITFLGVAIKQGDPVLGGVMMFAMALGMGVLLIAFGIGANWLLPKAGAWMERVKELFGFMILAVAIMVASAIKSVPIFYLWSALVFMLSFWLWHQTRRLQFDMLKVFFQVVSVMTFLWATALFVGGMTGAEQLQKPLDKLLNGKNNASEAVKVKFDVVETKEEINQYLQQAKLQSKPVLVDYYADWCTDCVRMEQSTYRDDKVVAALSNWRLLKIDVTKVNAISQAAKKRFGVFGPPATLFIGGDGLENHQARRYGYINSKDLLELINQTEIR